jgi:hypothetical protein
MQSNRVGTSLIGRVLSAEWATRLPPTPAERDYRDHANYPPSLHRICAWCGWVMHHGTRLAPVSHGVCGKCLGELTP